MPPQPSRNQPQPAYNHWYKRMPPRPLRRRRYSSSVINNVWNATSNWNNAAQGNAAGLLSTMRTQVDNIKQMIDTSGLYGSQKQIVQRLIAESKQALDSLNPALLSQQTSRTSFQSLHPATMQRTASEQSAISSNAKAALGCMAYLQDDQLFPGCSGTYQYVRTRLEQIFRLMDGEYQIADIAGARQQEQAAQQAAPTALNPDGSSTPFAPPATSSAQFQGVASAPTVSPSSQTSVPSPMAGLEPSLPWEGTPNKTDDGAEVGTHQDWFSLYGTTLEKFAARCTRWLQSNGGGQAALVLHLQQNGVPENVVGQVLGVV